MNFRDSLLVGAILMVLISPQVRAATLEKAVVASQDQMPRFNYAIVGKPSDLLVADEATFEQFSGLVRRNVDQTLARYDIRDAGTLRDLLTVRLNLQTLSGVENVQALETIARIRALEEKPDAKLVSNLRTELVLRARIASGASSGPAYQAAYRQALAKALATVPWPVVGNRLRELRGNSLILSRNVVIGFVKHDYDPGAVTSHQLSEQAAADLVRRRLQLIAYLPVTNGFVSQVTRKIAVNTITKPDIWPARDVTLSPAQVKAPVIVAIWDEGTDLSLFPTQTYTDPHPVAPAETHGLAFDYKSQVSTGYLKPLTPTQRTEYKTMFAHLQGFEDLQQAVDSPASDALRKKLAETPSDALPPYLEKLQFYSNYIHGTHVAGIAAHGNPAVRLAVARLESDWHTIPLLPTDALEQLTSTSYRTFVDWFKAHGVRVVNMSWGGEPKMWEAAFEANGVGKDPTERRILSHRLYKIERDALYDAMKNAPGVLFICAAGNSDGDSGFNESMPAGFDLPNLLVVGAVDQAGDEASFTSYGKTVAVYANGYQVKSQVPDGAEIKLSGTSMASPNAVNLAAKLIALDPQLTPMQVIRLITDGAQPSADGRRKVIDPRRSVSLLQG